MLRGHVADLTGASPGACSIVTIGHQAQLRPFAVSALHDRRAYGTTWVPYNSGSATAISGLGLTVSLLPSRPHPTAVAWRPAPPIWRQRLRQMGALRQGYQWQLCPTAIPRRHARLCRKQEQNRLLGYRSARTSRKPMRSPTTLGRLRSRHAARALRASFPHEPPRSTRRALPCLSSRPSESVYG
jgi:hypothetical protein